MTMTRRNFVKAGIGSMALALTDAEAHNAGGNAAFTVVGVDGSPLKEAMLDLYLSSRADVYQYSDNIIDPNYLDYIGQFVDAHSSKAVLVKSVNDIVAAKRAGKVAIVVGCQMCSPLEPEWQMLDQDTPSPTYIPSPNDWIANPPVTDLGVSYEKGLRMANLAYNTSNFFGGGGLDPSTPISRAGRYLVGAMQEIGILVDCSHSSEQTALDILAMAKRPVVASHSNVNGLNDNPRNISDRVIDGIARTGGLIGVNAWTVLLTWSRKDHLHIDADKGPFPPVASLSDYVDVMDYIRRRVGVDHIAMGTDWGAGGAMLPLPSKCFSFPPDMRYNEVNGLTYVRNFESVADLPNLRAELARRHYSASDIAKIMGGNWMRVFQQAW